MSTHQNDAQGENSHLQAAAGAENLPVTDFLSAVHSQVDASQQIPNDNHDAAQDDDGEETEMKEDSKTERPELKSTIFSGMYITWSGKFTYPREELRKKIEEHGGTCLENVSKKVTHVLTTPELTKPMTSRIEQALKYNIPLVDEQYIHDCVQHHQRLDLSKYLITISPDQSVVQQQSPQQQLQAQLASVPQMQLQYQLEDSQAAALQAQLEQQHNFDPASAQAYAAELLHQQQAQQLRQALQSMINHHAQQAALGADPGAEVAIYDNLTGAVENKQPDFDMSENSKLAIKMYVKGSRSTIFTEAFPDIFYTLTWKHKYDIRIICNKKIFRADNTKIMESLTMSLVLAKTNELPIYDEDKDAQKRKRKRQKVATPTNNKRKQKKPTDTDTITISSLHKASEHEILIRFGINSTYCSKRFNYSAFRLFINYAPNDLPDDFHFTIYSAEFKTFVKKNANITKYLNNPKPLNPTTVIITKDMTIKTKIPYAQVLQSGGNFTSPSPKKGGGQRKRKRNTENYEPEYDEEQAVAEEQQTQGEYYQGGDNNLMNIIYPLLPMFSQSQNINMAAQNFQYPAAFLKLPEKGVCWFGDPIGMNINGDIFYMAFCKDNVLYKINDFVYLAPEETDGGETQTQSQSDTQATQDASQIPASAEASTSQSEPASASAAAAAESSQAVETSKEEKPASEAPVESASAEQAAPQGEASASDTQTTASKEEGEEDIDISAIQSSAPESYWICKIINLVQTKNEGMKLIGQWFYRWCDVQGFNCNIESYSKAKTKKQQILQKEKEVFVSFDLNYNSLNTVRGKCFVKYMDMNNEGLKGTHISWLTKQHHYFFQAGFNRLRAEVFELPEQMLKIMKETTNDEDENQQGHLQQQIQQQLAAYQMSQGAQMMGAYQQYQQSMEQMAAVAAAQADATGDKMETEEGAEAQ